MKTTIFLGLLVGVTVGMMGTRPVSAQGQALVGITLLSDETISVNPSSGTGQPLADLSMNGILPVGLSRVGSQFFTFAQATGQVHTINSTTGAVGPGIDVGLPAGLFGQGGFTVAPDSRGWLTVGTNANPRPTRLYRVNPSTRTSGLLGEVQESGVPGVPLPIHALAFSTDNILFGVSTATRALYQIALPSAVATRVGSLGVVDPFMPNGMGNLPDATGNPAASMAFDQMGRLYLVYDDKLYLVNRQTGTASLLSPTLASGIEVPIGDFASITGIEFGALPPPAPVVEAPAPPPFIDLDAIALQTRIDALIAQIEIARGIRNPIIRRNTLRRLNQQLTIAMTGGLEESRIFIIRVRIQRARQIPNPFTRRAVITRLQQQIVRLTQQSSSS